jgi:hypothetical protein
MARLESHSEGKILDIFEDVHVYGAAVLPANKLLCMYNQDRLTKGIWRDLYDRWVRLSEQFDFDMPPELLVGHDADSGMVCFAYGREFDQETKDYKEPFLTDIKTRLSGKLEED